MRYINIRLYIYNTTTTTYGLQCVVIHVMCDPNRSRGYGAVGVENGPYGYPLLWPVAYTTACTTVQAVIIPVHILTLRSCCRIFCTCADPLK